MSLTLRFIVSLFNPTRLLLTGVIKSWLDLLMQIALIAFER